MLGWAGNFGAATVSFSAPNVHLSPAEHDRDRTGTNTPGTTPRYYNLRRSLLNSDGVRSCMNDELEEGSMSSAMIPG